MTDKATLAKEIKELALELSKKRCRLKLLEAEEKSVVLREHLPHSLELPLTFHLKFESAGPYRKRRDKKYHESRLLNRHFFLDDKGIAPYLRLVRGSLRVGLPLTYVEKGKVFSAKLEIQAINKRG